MHRDHVFGAFATSIVFGLALSGDASATPLARSAPLEVDIGFFYDGLAPYGDWVEVAEQGWVFVPRVRHDWRPYTVGHWAWTEDYGWLWVSEEEFGWAVFHYGRWSWEPDRGWFWVPGYEWAPAWVAWRSGGGSSAGPRCRRGSSGRWASASASTPESMRWSSPEPTAS